MTAWDVFYISPITLRLHNNDNNVNDIKNTNDDNTNNSIVDDFKYVDDCNADMSIKPIDDADKCKMCPIGREKKNYNNLAKQSHTSKRSLADAVRFSKFIIEFESFLLNFIGYICNIPINRKNLIKIFLLPGYNFSCGLLNYA